jgi:hypothetical protein
MKVLLNNRFQMSSCLATLLLCSAAQADQWVLTNAPREGDGAALCKDLLSRFRSMKNGCAWDAVESYPKFSEVPWQDLDPKEHIELITKLMKYWQEGPRRYFKGPAMQPDSAYQVRTKYFLDGGSRIQVWHGRLISFFYAGTQKAPDGEQTFIRLSDHSSSNNRPNDCPGVSSKGWVRSTFMVLPDLSGPDPQVDEGTARLLSNTWPVLYDKQILLINAHSVYSKYPEVPFIFCTFEPAASKPHTKSDK